MKEIQIKADTSGKNNLKLNVNGKTLRFNNSATSEIGLKDHVNLSLATTSDEEGAQPDRLLIRTNHAGAIKRPLGAQSGKNRNLTSEEVLRATGLQNGDHAILFDEANNVYYVEITPGAKRESFERSAPRVREQNKQIGEEIKKNKAAKAGAAVTK